ncbi:MAG: hypothetical protein Q7T00_03135 [Rugosibacter sp.]|nr:hypothetical protein [Rugosibacter sp.]
MRTSTRDRLAIASMLVGFPAGWAVELDGLAVVIGGNVPHTFRVFPCTGRRGWRHEEAAFRTVKANRLRSAAIGQS